MLKPWCLEKATEIQYIHQRSSLHLLLNPLKFHALHFSPYEPEPRGSPHDLLFQE